MVRVSLVTMSEPSKILSVWGIFSSTRKEQIKGYWVLVEFTEAIASSSNPLLRPFRRLAVKFSRYYVARWLALSAERWHKERRSINQAIESGPVEYDLVFILPEKAKGWILDGICRDLAKQFHGRQIIHYGFENVPQARAYFIAHYTQILRLLTKSPYVLKGKIFVWFTHLRHDLEESMGLHARLLNIGHVIFAHNQAVKRDLVALGTTESRIQVVVGAADPEIFLPHSRGAGKVGFCTAYYERKRPELILELLKSMPHRKFLMIGKGWEDWERFSELRALPNFEYVECPYTDYPKYYAQMDVFVSTSVLEGGPFPLLESMMCNIVPVSSRTGFAPDIIENGKNGYLFDTDADAKTVAALIEKAYSHAGDVSEGVRHFTWRRFAETIEKQIPDFVAP